MRTVHHYEQSDKVVTDGHAAIDCPAAVKLPVSPTRANGLHTSRHQAALKLPLALLHLHLICTPTLKLLVPVLQQQLACTPLLPSPQLRQKGWR